MNDFSFVFTARALIACSLLMPVMAQDAPHEKAFLGDPPDAHHPWAVHDRNRPTPTVVTPGTFSSVDQPGKPPSDAVVLFDGTAASLAKWEADKEGSQPTKWIVKDGAMECVPKSGYIRTKEHFGDCQLHVEWAAPAQVQGTGQGRGNSGIFLMGMCEIQVLDNFNNPTYADGTAGAMYDVNPPLVNALQPPGVFQVVDIIFRRPVYRDDQVLDPGYVTVLINGVLVQDHTMLEGPTSWRKRSKPQPFPATGPLKLQDHGNPVRYRNIWYRPLPPRAVEGGTDGYLSAEATTAKRAEIAATIRADAEALGKANDSFGAMIRSLESLVYATDAATIARVGSQLDAYIAALKTLPTEQLANKKAEVKQLSEALNYLERCTVQIQENAQKKALEDIIKTQNWTH